METIRENKNLFNDIVKNWNGLIFTDVSESKYKIIEKIQRHPSHNPRFNIEIIESRNNGPKVINGPSKPHLKNEMESYCIKESEKIYNLSYQYLCNITYRGYIGIKNPRH